MRDLLLESETSDEASDESRWLGCGSTIAFTFSKIERLARLKLRLKTSMRRG